MGDADTAGEPPQLRVLRVYHSAVVASWRAREHALHQAGVDVTLVSPRSWNEGGAQVHLGDEHEPWVVPARTVGSHPYLFAYNPLPILRVLRSQPFDVLDVHEEPASVAALQLRALAWLTGHRRTPLLLYGAQNIDKRYPLPFRWIERGSLRRARAVYPCNEEAGDIFVRKGFAGTVRTLPLGVPVSTFRPGPFVHHRRDGTFRVGFVGRLEEHKGVHVALAAMALLPDHVLLEVVGDGPYRSELEQQVDASGLGARVTFRGHLPQAHTNTVYREFDVLVVPSQTRPNWVEQFGRVVVESMASGTPVVVSDSGSLPEVTGDAGLVVPEADVDAWADALRQLANDPELRRQLRERALARAPQFDWATVAAAQAALYREVAACPTAT